MNYTNGEWEVKQKELDEAIFFENFTLLVQSEKLVIALCDREHWDKHKERLANANLIAAAPDMYEALSDLAACFRNTEILGNIQNEGEKHSLEIAINSMSKALAKAAGKESK